MLKDGEMEKRVRKLKNRSIRYYTRTNKTVINKKCE